MYPQTNKKQKKALRRPKSHHIAGSNKPKVFNVIHRALAHFNDIMSSSYFDIGESQICNDTVLKLASLRPLLYDKNGRIVLPSLFPTTCLGRYFVHYTKNNHDGLYHKRFLRLCLYAVENPAKNAHLLHHIADMCVGSLIRQLHDLHHHHHQQEEEGGQNIGLTLHQQTFRTKLNSNSTLSLRHVHFGINILKAIQSFCTTHDSRRAKMRTRCFFLQSKVSTIMTLMMNQPRTDSSSTKISSLLELSQHVESCEKENSKDSFLYLLFSTDTHHTYLGETTNIVRRAQQHLYAARDTLPTLASYKIWQSLGQNTLSCIAVPCPKSLRKAKEIELIRHHSPTMNTQYRSKFRSDERLLKYKNVELSKLTRSVPIPNRSDGFRKLTTEKGKMNVVVKKCMTTTPDQPDLVHKSSNTMFVQKCEGYPTVVHPTLRDLLHSKASLGERQTDIKVVLGKSEITRLENDQISSEIRLYDISALQPHHKYPFRVYTISTLIRYINAGMISSFTFSKCRRIHSYAHLSDKEKVHLIGRCRTVTGKMLKNTTPRQIHHLYQVANRTISEPTIRERAKLELSNLFRKKYGISINTKLKFSLPQYYGNNKNKIKSYVSAIIDGYHIPQHVKSFLRRTVTVVFTSQPTSQLLLANNIKFGQNWTLSQHESQGEDGYQCRCQHLSDKFHIPLDDHGHIRINGMDIPTSSPVHHLLGGNMRNKTRPTMKHFSDKWTEQVKLLHSQIRHISSKTGCYRGQPYGPNKRLLTATGKIEDGIFSQIHKSDEHLNHILHEQNIHIPYTSEVLEFSKQASPYLVMSELGKGKGCIHLTCKKYFSESEKSNFWDNTKYFELQPNLTTESVIKLWEETYKQKGWSRIAPLLTSKIRVPYLYLQPKRKDFMKFRPLASYYFHKLKVVYRTAGQALMVILKTIQEPHLNLFTTYSTKPKINEIFDTIDKFSSEHGCQPHVETYSGDVQRLFTELDFDTVKKSLEWAVSTVKKTKTARGRHFVTINRLDKNMSRIGPKYSGMALSELSFADILDICLFDAQHAFFQKNEHILRQVFGLAQGSPISPPAAVCVLIYTEFHFLESIRDDSRFSKCKFLGIRYVDDVRIIVICIPIPGEIAKSKELIEMFVKSLPDSLLLEPEENRNNTFRFLEAYEFFNDKNMKSAFVAKNFDIYEQKPEYELLAGYPFQTYLGSYCDNPKKEMENNIYTRLFSVEAYSITPAALEMAIASCMPDFKFSNFPLRSVKNVMKRFTHHLAPEMRNVWTKTIIPRYTQTVYDHIHMWSTPQS